jgi:hypothetical protein
MTRLAATRAKASRIDQPRRATSVSARVPVGSGFIISRIWQPVTAFLPQRGCRVGGPGSAARTPGPGSRSRRTPSSPTRRWLGRNLAAGANATVHVDVLPSFSSKSSSNLNRSAIHQVRARCPAGGCMASSTLLLSCSRDRNRDRSGAWRPPFPAFVPRNTQQLNRLACPRSERGLRRATAGCKEVTQPQAGFLYVLKGETFYCARIFVCFRTNCHVTPSGSQWSRSRVRQP